MLRKILRKELVCWTRPVPRGAITDAKIIEAGETVSLRDGSQNRAYGDSSRRRGYVFAIVTSFGTRPVRRIARFVMLGTGSGMIQMSRRSRRKIWHGGL